MLKIKQSKDLRHAPPLHHGGACLINPPKTAMYFGPDEVLFNLDIQFPKGLAVSDVVAAVDRLEKEIRNRHPEITRIFIEADSVVSAEASGNGHRGDGMEADPEKALGKPQEKR